MASPRNRRTTASSPSEYPTTMLSVQRQPAPVPFVTHPPDMTGPLQPVHDGRGRAGGDAEALTEITGRQRPADPVAVDDGEQRGPVGRVQVMPLGEGASEPYGLDHVALQQPDQFSTGIGRGTGRGLHGRGLYRRPTSLFAEVIDRPRHR